MVSTDAAEQVHQGETISTWVQLAGTADGRAYLGFGSIAPSLTQDTSAFKTLALVLAPNTGQLLLQNISAPSGTQTFTTFGTAAQTYQADHWYRAEVAWGSGGSITGKLYDSDGTTLLNTVTGTSTLVASGNIGIRAFGSDKYFDTYVVDTDSTATPQQLVDAGGGLDPSWVYQTPPTAPTNGPSGGGVPLPWAYTNYTGPGPLREIQLDEWDSLAQFGISGGQVIVAGTNTSHNIGTGPNAAGVDWGPALRTAGGPATPQLAQYILRMLPGQATQLISTSSVKHFFAPSILDPGQTDAYGSGLNASPSYFTYGSELNPVTGELYRPSDIGSVDVNGINQNTLAVPSAYDVAPHVAVADLDPAQNPVGTRWFAMANVYVEGEADVTHASRWVEFVPHFNGTTFTFTYPNGPTGQLNFRTIPNLALPAAGPVVTGSTPTGTVFGTVNHITVTFDRPIDASTFDTTSINRFTRTVGTNVTDLSGSLIAVTPVSGSTTQFNITFDSQGAAGRYDLNLGPNILDTSGNAMDQDQDGVPGEATDTYTATFTIQGPQITSTSPTGNILSTVSAVRVTFNEPIDASSFDLSRISSFTRTNGTTATDISSSLIGVTPVSGTSNQFDITFSTETMLGAYSLVIAPGILDLGGNPTTSPATASYTIQGLQVTGLQAPAGATAPGQVYTFRVTFNKPVDLARTSLSQVSLTGPDGDHPILGAVPVPGSNYMQFDVLFAPLTAAGTYQASVGPLIYDVYGNAMDQDGDLVDGESTDVFTLSRNLAGPRLTASSPTGTVSTPVDHVRLTFNEPMDAASFDPTQATLTGPGGASITVTSITAVPYTNNTQFDVNFDAQGLIGTYNLTLTGETDLYANPLASPATATFSIAGGPQVVSYSPTGSVTGPVDHVTVTFSRAMDTSTLIPDHFTLVDGGGNSVAITTVTEVSASGGTQFDVNFAAQTTTGSYTLTLLSGITDTFGNPLIAVSPTNIVTNGGFETGSFSGWTTIPASSGSLFGVITGHAHSGTYAAEFGDTVLGNYDTITQTLATTPGVQYTFSYWLSNAGGPSNGFRVMWGSTVVQDLIDSSAFAYTQTTVTVTATSTSTTISFAGYQLPSYFYLDDISVIPNTSSITDTFTIT
jgi:hypothetical protein